jgi:hypothetical protein
MGKKYEVRARSAISGTPLPAHMLNEGVWVDPKRSLENTDEADEAEARWQLWMETYEIKVLYDNHWLLSAGFEEEGI